MTTKIKTTLERISDFLSKAGKAKADSVATALSIEESIITAILDAQVKRRRIKRTRYGYYSIPNSPVTPAPVPAPKDPDAASFTTVIPPRKLQEMTITTQDFAERILGKTLTYRQMRELIEQEFDGFTVPVADIRLKMQTLRNSPFVNIERINGDAVAYHLISIGPDFFRYTSRAVPDHKSKPRMCKKPDNGRYERIIRTARFDRRESECCRLTAVFNSLLMPVRQRYVMAAGLLA